MEVGKQESKKAGIENITFVKGVAEELPFLDDSFVNVISRLAFHHFVNPKEIFAEMKRVLKPGGKLVLMDLTYTSQEKREEITALMESDLAGKTVTGFAPYRKDEIIYFKHHWVFNLGQNE